MLARGKRVSRSFRWGEKVLLVHSLPVQSWWVNGAADRDTWNRVDQYLLLLCLPCSQKRKIMFIWPYWEVSIPSWRLNEKLVFLLLCWPKICVLILLSLAMWIVLQVNEKTVMKKCFSHEWGLQDQALHDWYNPGHWADMASLIWKSNPISIKGKIHK